MRKQITLAVFILFFLSILYAPSASAFTHHAISNWWQELTGEIEEELERTRVGRELNRIIEDVGKVGEIAGTLVNLASLATSTVTPAGIANLAVQYGHDPDKLFARFQERVQSLQSRHNEQLSNMEMAAALQSVLEEPALPDGVYMGGSCVIDLTGCPENLQSRGDYYQYSCYLEGSVSKKKANNINRAACAAQWLDAGGGRAVEIKFPADTQYAAYDWERCARVILLQGEQRQFLTSSRNRSCNQPIAKHDIGDVCVVDYSSCSYAGGAQYNANRVGTIIRGLLPIPGQSSRLGYACRITYGTFALNEEWRDSCAAVYAGEIEVDEYLAAHPEPAQQLQPQQLSRQSPAGLLSLYSRNVTEIVALADIPVPEEREEREEISVVYGKEGLIELWSPSVQAKKNSTKQKLQKLGAYTEFNFDKIKTSVEGQVLPGSLQKLFGNENIKVTIHQNYGGDLEFCIAIVNGVINEFAGCSAEFAPTLKMVTSQTVLESLESENDLLNAVDTGKISYKAVGLRKKIKFGISSMVLKLFS